MITYANRDDILANATNDNVFDHYGRRVILSGPRTASRYGVIADGAAAGHLVRVDYVAPAARYPGIARVRILAGEDESRGDNAVTFGIAQSWTGRTPAANMAH